MHFESSPSGTDEKAAESLSNISLLLLVKSYGDNRMVAPFWFSWGVPLVGNPLSGDLCGASNLSAGPSSSVGGLRVKYGL